jgi:hypothetical protein
LKVTNSQLKLTAAPESANAQQPIAANGFTEITMNNKYRMQLTATATANK